MVLAEDAADRCDSAELAVPPSIKPQASGSRQDCRHRAGSAWRNNKALVYVVLSQLFGTLMNVTTRLLEVDGNHGQGMHPLQILFARMVITVALSMLYMWYTDTADFPLGARQVRLLLAARGLTGFFGVFGLYYSIVYLPLADATVLTFLAPGLACFLCSVFINEPFTRLEQIGTLFSLAGVVLIARPTSMFATAPSPSPSPPSLPLRTNSSDAAGHAGGGGYGGGSGVGAAQRAAAVGVAMTGVLGAAGAYTSMRWIGMRAHPLITVTYFAVFCTGISLFGMLCWPGVGFQLPADGRHWLYLVSLGVFGFIMQVLLAAGLQQERSSRATNMIYVQMIFALAADKLVFNTLPGSLSVLGSSLILGSTVYVAVRKGHAVARPDGPGAGGPSAGLSTPTRWKYFRSRPSGSRAGLDEDEEGTLLGGMAEDMEAYRSSEA